MTAILTARMFWVAGLLAVALIVAAATGADAAITWASDDPVGCVECAAGIRGWACHLGNLLTGACRDAVEGARTIWY